MNPTNTKDLNDPLRLFPARILDKVQEGSEWRYAWASMLPSTTDGAYPADPLDPSSGMIAPWYGTTTTNYALALNNAEVDVDSEVWMRLRGMAMGQHVYEFGPPLGTQNTVPGGPRGGCGLAVLKPTDCLSATVSYGSQSVFLESGDGITWTSSEAVDYPLGSGTLTITHNTTYGIWIATLNGMVLDSCGNGCFMGGPATGHVNNAEGDEACDGDTFSVCFGCRCCYEPDKWYCADLGDGCEAVFLENGDECTTDICSGPYETYGEAVTACPASLAATTNCPASLGPILAVGTVAGGTVNTNGFVPVSSFDVKWEFTVTPSTTYRITARRVIQNATIPAGTTLRLRMIASATIIGTDATLAGAVGPGASTENVDCTNYTTGGGDTTLCITARFSFEGVGNFVVADWGPRFIIEAGTC